MIVKVKLGEFEVSIANVKNCEDAANLINTVVAGYQKIKQPEAKPIVKLVEAETKTESKPQYTKPQVKTFEKPKEEETKKEETKKAVVKEEIDDDEEEDIEFDPKKIEAEAEAASRKELKEPELDVLSKKQMVSDVVKYLVFDCNFKSDEDVYNKCKDLKNDVLALSTIKNDRQLREKVSTACMFCKSKVDGFQMLMDNNA